MRTSEILSLLCCPSCGASFELEATDTAADGHVMSGALICGGCRHRFAITRGVPRLIVGTLAHAVQETVDAFGYQWKQANAVLKDARFSAPEVFLDFIHPVQPAWFAGKAVLDAGCGIGRFTIAAAAFGARLVVGVDLSTSVDVAFDNTRHLPNVVIVQGDIFHLPVAPVIDYGFSVAVLHHTGDSRRAFLQVVSRVKSGGSVSAWVYGRENNGWIVHVVNPIRTVTSRLPRGLLLAVSHLLALPLFAALMLVYRPVARRPALKWLRGRLFYFKYMEFLTQFGYRELAFIIFDHLVPSIAEYIRGEDFTEWFQAAGLRDVVITMRGGNSWRGFGHVPV